MLRSPSGKGKIEIGMVFVCGARSKNKRVIFLCNRLHLVELASRRFTKASIARGIIQGEEINYPKGKRHASN
jgi:hypothetical protein